MQIVSFLPAERLDDLVAATGFNLEGTSFEYKYTWLLERIGLLRGAAEIGNILHDNPDKEKLVAMIQYQRRVIAAEQNTIAGLQSELERLRK